MPQDLDDLRYALAFAEQEDLPLIVIGGGNNVLVSDRGLQAVVVKLGGILSRAEFSGDEVAVGAGMPLSASSGRRRRRAWARRSRWSCPPLARSPPESSPMRGLSRPPLSTQVRRAQGLILSECFT